MNLIDQRLKGKNIPGYRKRLREHGKTRPTRPT
jgi:hypothetical protein